MLGSLVYVGNKRADLQKHLELASEQILLSQRIATYSFGASSGRENDFGQLLRARNRFEDILSTYRNGDDLSGVPPLSQGLLVDLDTAETDWQQYRNDVDIILRGKKPIAEIQELYDVIDSFVPQLLTFSDEVVGVLIKKEGSKRQIYLASRQMMLSQRIKNNLDQVLAGGESAAAAADRFGRDASLFGRVLEGLLKGSKTLRIEKVTDKESISKLREVAMLISAVSANVAGILELSPELFEVKDAANKIEADGNTLLKSLQDMEQSVIAQGDFLDKGQLVGVGFGLLQ